MADPGGLPRPWWRDPRAVPPFLSRAKETNQVGPGEVPLPHLFNIYMMLVMVGIVGSFVWAYGVGPGIAPVVLGVGALLLRTAPQDRRWRRNHPGRRPRMTFLHWSVGLMFGLFLVTMILAGLGAHHHL